jgi:hypothetical protein
MVSGAAASDAGARRADARVRSHPLRARRLEN